MKRLPYILSILLAGVVSAQTIYVTDQNIFDLNPSRDAISGLAGAQRIKASFWEDSSYTIPLDVAAALPITLTISSTVDDYTVSVLNSATSTPPNVVWWVVPFLNAGTYRAQATAVFPDDQFPVFDRFFTLTNAPVQPTSFFLTNEVTVGAVSVTNIFGDTIITNDISVAGVTVTNITEAAVNIYNTTEVITSGVSSVSVTGAVDGALTFEGNAVTQTGTTFNFSYDRAFVTNEYTTNSLSVYELLYGGASTNVATVSASGLRAQSGNNYWTYDNVGVKYNNSNVLYRFGPGYYALNSPDGFPFQVLSDAVSDNDIVNYRTATNLIATLSVSVDDGFTNIVTEGSGNVVTNLVYGGRTVTQQLGTVSGGGGGGDVYLASNNTFAATATNTFEGPIYFGASKFFAKGGDSGTHNVLIGNEIATFTASGQGNVIVGGDRRANQTLSSAGNGNAIVGGRDPKITAGNGNGIFVGRGSQITATEYANAIVGGQSQTISGISDGSVILGGILLNISSSDESVIVGGEYNTISSSQNSVVLGGNFNNVHGSAYSIAGGYNADVSANYALAFGYALTNVHDGVHMFRTYDGDSTPWSSAATNTFIVKTGGFGINTNNPQADLHVKGMVQIDSVKVYASGTNLYLTDGATYTNLITTTPL